MSYIPDKFNGLIKKIFKQVKTYQILFQSEDTTLINGELPDPVVWTIYKTIEGLYIKSTGNRKNISDKYRSDVDAVIILDAKDISESEILENSKISITNIGDFAIIYSDDIAGQNIVLMLYVKEWK